MTYPWLQREITCVGKGLKRGDHVPDVRKVQEWLTLHDFGVAIDGDFGPATERAVMAFQQKNDLSGNGVVDQGTFAALTAPLQRVLSPPSAAPTLGAMMLACAGQHLEEHPREVGGQNRGPWVRLYMEGNEGQEWAWCAGFTCFIMRQAADALPAKLPVKPTFSCDELAARARAAGIFVSGMHLTDPVSQLTPGSIFLNRKSVTDWTHAGLVTAVHNDTFESIEGNTNDAGDREGYEVCRRIRGYDNKDFVRIQ
ncbi:peptidoglycan-binding protein [Geobacter sp. SVR]|uniref:peptidoglycan-binding domain-containing protein n=1 Tax=Geobacter sp. SVR TaxID=2495594 RepID=UPI00143EF585|nr:peptidoglycan-binding domain-containing protein [Geobacter sp. SVR]BCS53130.1 hypothetical protein GSVR_14380 [Geobacter sp. SVR]GCF84515.1 hypothetical protein GSbR_11150 [Geobacter sp. SVR]